MSTEFPDKKGHEQKPLAEMTEQEEIEIREFTEEALGAIRDYLVEENRNVKEALPDMSGGSEDQEFADMIESIDPREAAPRIYEMAKQGNDALLLAILGYTLVQGERYGADNADEGHAVEYSSHVYSRIYQAFEKVLRASERFRKEYTKEDLIRWLYGDEEAHRAALIRMRDMKMSPSKKGFEEYKLLDRIAAGDIRKEDLEGLEQLLDQRIDEKIHIALGEIPVELKNMPNQSPHFENFVGDFIDLYHLRKFAPDIVRSRSENKT